MRGPIFIFNTQEQEDYSIPQIDDVGMSFMEIFEDSTFKYSQTNHWTFLSISNLAHINIATPYNHVSRCALSILRIIKIALS